MARTAGSMGLSLADRMLGRIGTCQMIPDTLAAQTSPAHWMTRPGRELAGLPRDHVQPRLAGLPPRAAGSGPAG